jgi:hypothetical protein
MLAVLDSECIVSGGRGWLIISSIMLSASALIPSKSDAASADWGLKF